MRTATVSDVGYVAGADQAYYRIHTGNMHRRCSICLTISPSDWLLSTPYSMNARDC
jgi:hypothetical protein